MNNWLDFSGAPPLLIPKRLIGKWGGAVSKVSGECSDLNTREPHTDYDHACKEAWPGKGILSIGDSSALALYTEFDNHAWDEEKLIVACGGWLPTDEQVAKAQWSDALEWHIEEAEFLLLNSAASGILGLREDDFIDVHLHPGKYIVEYAEIESDYVGCFHRFRCIAGTPSAN
jgi:Immunity protein 21